MFRIRNRNFWLVFASFVLPSASLVLTIYALSFFLLEFFAESPELISFSELMNTIPVLAGFLFIGLAVDRFHRKRLAVAALLLRFLFAALVLVSLYFDWLGLAFAMLFGRMLFHKLFTTMEMAIIQGLLHEQDYIQAASLKQFVNGFLAIAGSFVALFIYREFGITGIILVDCLFTLFAVILLSLARIPIHVCLPNGQQNKNSIRQSIHSLWLDVKQGFQYVWSSSIYRSFLFAFIFFGLVNAILATLPLYSLRFVLTNNIELYQQYTVLFSFLLGLSFVLGSLLFSFIGKAFSVVKTIRFGLIMLTLLLPTLGFFQNPVPFFIVVFVIGATIVIINVSVGAWIPKVVDPAFMGRTYSLFDPVSVATKSFGLIVCGWLYPNILKLEFIYLLFAILLLISSVLIIRLVKQES